MMAKCYILGEKLNIYLDKIDYKSGWVLYINENETMIFKSVSLFKIRPSSDKVFSLIF